MTNAPKTSFELAMERLLAADREAGLAEERPLGEEEKKAIAEARAQASARLAEREILHRDALRKAADPETRSRLEEEYRIDRARIESDRDRAIQKIRAGGL